MEDDHSRNLFAVRTLGEGLRLLQMRSGIRRDELARTVGISSGSLSNYMNGVSMPSAALLWRIAGALAPTMGFDRELLWAELGSLLAEGIADGRGVEPAPPAIRAYVLVDSSTKDVGLLEREIARLPGVLSVDSIEGPHDLIVLGEGASLRKLVDDVVDGIHRLPGIVRTTTCISLVE